MNFQNTAAQKPPTTKINKVKPKVQDMQDQDDQFEFDNQFDNMREDDDFLLEDDDANEALKDIEIEEMGSGLMNKGNFADLDRSNNNSEDSDGGHEFNTEAKNESNF